MMRTFETPSQGGRLTTVARSLPAVWLLALAILPGCGGPPGTTAVPGAKAPPAQVRLGYFANVTHAQALIGVSRGDFQKALGSVPLQTVTFNAGPSAIEAIFAGALDITYIGPSPALNAYVKSKGQAVRIVSGVAANGVAIVARKDSGIAKLEDLVGKRIATPQLGNTQDVSARHYVLSVLKAPLKDKGGATEIQPIANAEQLGLFKSGRIDAAWVPEPWGARLVHEAGGVVIEEEKNLWPRKNFVVAVVLVSTKFLERYPETVEAFLKAHVEITNWVNADRDQAAAVVNTELARLTHKALKKEVLADAFARLNFSTDPFTDSIETFAAWAYDLGFAGEKPDLKGLVDLRLLEKVQRGGKAP
jgi:NitT/TauT family transport system substrate-binding protein